MMNLPLNVDFTGKVVVVTGAGGVLCGDMARAFAQAGAKVAALDLNEEAVKKLAEECREEGFICEGYKANVLDPEALKAVRGAEVSSCRCRTVVLAPAGIPYTQEKAHEFSGLDHLILVCGHYEGFDARILGHTDEMISVGDYVLTGGELPAMIIADSVLRLLPGILKSGSAEEESFENGLLEYPQYTQPANLEGMKVPEVLLSGDHARIRRWRLKEYIRLTYRNRPDLLKKRGMNEEEQMLFCEVLEEEQETLPEEIPETLPEETQETQ